MSGQHRTDPRAWENVGVEYLRGSSAAACLLELRARIEALEATQQIRVFSAEEVAPIVVTTTEARPAERLWERMEDAGRRELDDNPHAEQAEFYQAMLREVAAWLRTGRLLHAAELLEQEADRG
jgi:hypothetical protein